ncbi:MAG: hypothetical protein R6X14_03465 [bacterium]
MMMDARTIAALALTLGLACPADPGPGPFAVRPPEWLSGETALYQVTRNDSVLYQIRVVLRLDEEIVQSPTGPRPAPTVLVTSTVRPVEVMAFFYDSSVAVFRRDSLLPLRSERHLETDLASFLVEATYGPGRVRIRKQSIDGSEDTTLTLSGRVMDQDMIRTALRAVLPEPGSEFELAVVSPLDLRVREARLKGLGTKLVAAPLDSVLCREYEYDLGTRQVRLWYEIAQPRRLVGFSDPVNGIKMLLVEYEPGGQEAVQVPVPGYR